MRPTKDTMDLCNAVETIGYERKRLKADRAKLDARANKLDDQMADLLPLARRVFAKVGYRAIVRFGDTLIGWDASEGESGEPVLLSVHYASGITLDEPGPEEDDTVATFDVPMGDDDSLVDLTERQLTDAEAERISFVGSIERDMGIPLSVLPEAATTAAMAKFKQFQAERNATPSLALDAIDRRMGIDDGEDTPKRIMTPGLHEANGTLIGGVR